MHRTTMDLGSVPVVDGFGHMFDPARSGERGGRFPDPARDSYHFAREWSVASIHPQRDRVENTVLFKKVVRELATLLDCPPDPETVSAKRDELYAGDPPGYVARLWAHANISLMVFDTGAPTVEDIPLETMRRLLPCPFRTMHRIDASIHGALTTDRPFSDVLRSYRDSIDRAVLEDSPVALKTVNAAFTGLDIEVFAQQDADEAFERMRRNSELLPEVPKRRGVQDSTFTWYPVALSKRPVKRDEKIVRDFLVTEGIRKAIEHDIPFDFHTALGAAPYFDMNRAHPLLLHDVLADDTLRQATIVLVHGGYPWVEESAYLVGQFDNVYVDLGQMFPMSGPGMKGRFAALLEMAPVTKIMFGSDGFGIPEVFWFAAVQGKIEVWAALEDLVERDWLLRKEAVEVMGKIFSENARRVYGLD